jgi:hypothetical protein
LIRKFEDTKGVIRRRNLKKDIHHNGQYKTGQRTNNKSTNHYIETGAYLRKIAHMASTNIALYIYHLLIISPCIHFYVYYMFFAKLLQENY